MSFLFLLVTTGKNGVCFRPLDWYSWHAVSMLDPISSVKIPVWTASLRATRGCAEDVSLLLKVLIPSTQRGLFISWFTPKATLLFWGGWLGYRVDKTWLGCYDGKPRCLTLQGRCSIGMNDDQWVYEQIGLGGTVAWLTRSFWFWRVLFISICILDLQLMLDLAVSSNRWIWTIIYLIFPAVLVIAQVNAWCR